MQRLGAPKARLEVGSWPGGAAGGQSFGDSGRGAGQESRGDAPRGDCRCQALASHSRAPGCPSCLAYSVHGKTSQGEEACPAMSLLPSNHLYPSRPCTQLCCCPGTALHAHEVPRWAVLRGCTEAQAPLCCSHHLVGQRDSLPKCRLSTSWVMAPFRPRGLLGLPGDGIQGRKWVGFPLQFPKGRPNHNQPQRASPAGP